MDMNLIETTNSENVIFVGHKTSLFLCKSTRKNCCLQIMVPSCLQFDNITLELISGTPPHTGSGRKPTKSWPRGKFAHFNSFYLKASITSDILHSFIFFPFWWFWLDGSVLIRGWEPEKDVVFTSPLLFFVN